MILTGGSSARADWSALPESRHHLYQTYANFIEQHNMLVWRGGNKYWAVVAVNLPLAGNNEAAWHPQLILHVSAAGAMHVNGGGGVFTETLDTRLGLFYEVRVPELWNLGFSAGFQHESGHTADGTDDPALDPLDLGDNTIRITAFKDLGQTVRAALMLAPVVNSIPEDYPTLAALRAEYFPWESSEGTRGFSPFISSSVEHRVSFTRGRVNFEAQVGMALGNHFQDAHTHDMRFAVGYYYGADPRAKYYQYDKLRASFGYLALMFNL